jgi:hypothetical protein
LIPIYPPFKFFFIFPKWLPPFTIPKGYEVNERLSTADCVVFNRINERAEY